VGGGAANIWGRAATAFAAAPRLAPQDDVLGVLLAVVLGPDRHRLDLLLRADDVLQSRAELGREAPMGDEYEADHGAPRRRVPFAPHERPPIMTIRSPCARGFPAICGWCCIAVRAPFPRPAEGELSARRLFLCHRARPQGS